MNALQSEMALGGRGMAGDVKASAVVCDGKAKGVVLNAPGDEDDRRHPVPGGIGRQFADDAENGVRRIVREAFARHIEADDETCVAQMRRECLPDGRVHVGHSQGVVPEVPQAVSELRMAGAKGLRRDVQMAMGRGRVLVGSLVGCVNLERHAGQRLRKGIMKFDGESRPFVDAQLRTDVRNLLLEQEAAAVLDGLPQADVPDENGD